MIKTSKLQALLANGKIHSKLYVDLLKTKLIQLKLKQNKKVLIIFAFVILSLAILLAIALASSSKNQQCERY